MPRQVQKVRKKNPTLLKAEFRIRSEVSVKQMQGDSDEVYNTVWPLLRGLLKYQVPF